MSSELERTLRELGRELSFPTTPDLAALVGERLRRRRQWSRPLGLALAVLAVALAGILLVPAARTSLLELLRLRGATIQRVDRLPPVKPPGRLALGVRVSLAEAERRAGFPVLHPRAYGDPDAVFLSEAVPGGLVSLLYGTEREVRLLLSEFRGSAAPALVDKRLGPGAAAVRVSVGGDPGFWIEGEPHAVLFRDATNEVREDLFRLSARTLLWQRGPLLLRLESRLSRAEAIRVAESLR